MKRKKKYIQHTDIAYVFVLDLLIFFCFFLYFSSLYLALCVTFSHKMLRKRVINSVRHQQPNQSETHSAFIDSFFFFRF